MDMNLKSSTCYNFYTIRSISSKFTQNDPLLTLYKLTRSHWVKGHLGSFVAKNVFWGKMAISPKEGVLQLRILPGKFTFTHLFYSKPLVLIRCQEGVFSRTRTLYLQTVISSILYDQY